jgi:hypothetical protein
MDLVTGAKRVIVGMQHSDNGRPKIVPACTLPLTSIRSVDLVVTELAVIGFSDGCATLLELAPDVSIEQILAATPIHLNFADCPPQMASSGTADQPRRKTYAALDVRDVLSRPPRPTSKALDITDACSIAQRRERRDLCDLLALGNERQEHAKPNAACR